MVNKYKMHRIGIYDDSAFHTIATVVCLGMLNFAH